MPLERAIQNRAVHDFIKSRNQEYRDTQRSCCDFAMNSWECRRSLAGSRLQLSARTARTLAKYLDVYARSDLLLGPRLFTVPRRKREKDATAGLRCLRYSAQTLNCPQWVSRHARISLLSPRRGDKWNTESRVYRDRARYNRGDKQDLSSPPRLTH